MITLEVNGREFKGFTRAEAFVSMDMISGAFSFETSSQPGISFPIKKKDDVVVRVDGFAVVSGPVEKIEVSYSGSNKAITIMGRDRIADLVDGTVGDVKDIQTPISLETVCRIVMDGMGLQDLKIFNNAGTLDRFTEKEKVSAEVGQRAFEFLESYARKRQVLLNSDGDSNLVLERNSSIVLRTKILNIINGTENNVLSSTAVTDDSNLFNTYIVRSQANPSAVGADFADDAVSDISGRAVDDQIRESRVLEINGEQSMDAAACQKRAEWEANIRRARGNSASYTIPGHSASGELWRPNRLVDVVDQWSDISAQMLIKDCRYTYSKDSGSITAMSLVPEDAYLLQAPSKSGQQKKNDNFMSGFTLQDGDTKTAFQRYVDGLQANEDE